MYNTLYPTFLFIIDMVTLFPDISISIFSTNEREVIQIRRKVLRKKLFSIVATRVGN